MAYRILLRDAAVTKIRRTISTRLAGNGTPPTSVATQGNRRLAVLRARPAPGEYERMGTRGKYEGSLPVVQQEEGRLTLTRRVAELGRHCPQSCVAPSKVSGPKTSGRLLEHRKCHIPPVYAPPTLLRARRQRPRSPPARLVHTYRGVTPHLSMIRTAARSPPSGVRRHPVYAPFRSAPTFLPLRPLQVVPDCVPMTGCPTG